MISLAGNLSSPAESPQVVINKAIQAIGGRQRLGSYKAITWSELGKYLGQEPHLTYRGEYAVAFPNRYRMRVKGAITIVVNEDQGWINTHGQVESLPEPQLNEYREANHAIWAMQLHPLIEDQSFHLRFIRSAELAEPNSIGIRVSSPGHRDLELYFDKQLFLLTRSVRTGFLPETGHQEIEMETIYEEHMRIEGILFPTRLEMRYNGRQVLISRNSNYCLHEQVEPSWFERPC